MKANATGPALRLAIMQPYFFPYLGYFQLAAAVDRFVFYDDVNFIKNGWINRNRWCVNGRAGYFTIPLAGASSFMRIHEVCVSVDPRWKYKMLQTLRHSYRKARHYPQIAALFESVLLQDDMDLASYAKSSVMRICQYLGLSVQFVASSRTYRNEKLHGEARVLDICEREAIDTYVNLPGGRTLYSVDQFAARGVTLRFLDVQLPSYRQDAPIFISGLSIIDILMHNDTDQVLRMLRPVQGLQT